MNLHTATEIGSVRRSGTRTRILRTPYHAALLSGEVSDGKREIRDIVYEAVMDHQPAVGNRSMLTLPGPCWSMENELFRETRGKINFVAFEKHMGLLRPGIVRMPRPIGDHTAGWMRFLPCGAAYYATAAATLVYADLLDWCLLDADEMIMHNDPNVDGYKHWLKDFWGCSSAWLDFTAPLHMRMLKALERLPHLFGHDVIGDKPVTVTIQKGREQKDATGVLRDANMNRAEYVAFLLDKKPQHTLDVLSEHEYTNARGTVMLSINCVWKDQRNLH